MAAVTLAYSNSFQGEFIFDDLQSIVENPAIRQLWPPWEAMFPPAEHGRTVEGRPLLGLSLALNYRISGLEVWSYHLFNLIVHLLAALTLFGVVRRTLRLPRLRARFAEHSTWLALAIALLWGVHPLGTQAVTYVIQRAESMMGLFYLLTLYCVIRGEHSSRPAAWFSAAVLSCAAGMATKEVMATAPLVVALYERVFVFGSWSETLRRRIGLFICLSATWMILAALVISTEGRGSSVGFADAVTPWQYLLTQCVAIVHYLRLCFIPWPLIFDYGAEPVTEPSLVIACAAILAILLAGTLWALRFKPAIGFLGASFFLILAPSSSFVPIVTQVISEHRMYLPLAAVLTLTVIGLHLGWRVLRERPWAQSPERHWLRVVPAASLAVAVGVLSFVTWLRNFDYRTSMQVWEEIVARRPGNVRGYTNLGQEYFRAGYSAEAIELLRRGISLIPDSHLLFYNRGTFYLLTGEFAAAEADLSRAIELKADFAEAYLNRGLARRFRQRHQEAVEDFTRCLQLRPAEIMAYKNRAVAYQALGELTNARDDVRTFIELGGEPDELLLEILKEAG